MPRDVTLVIALEDSATAGVVSAGAAHLAMEQGAKQVVLLHVLDTHPIANALYGGGALSVPVPATPAEESSAEAEEILSIAEEAFRAEYGALDCPLPPISRKLCEGRSYAAAIARVAADSEARAIVVGARRPHAFGRLTHPDVRAALSNHTTLPIYVVPLNEQSDRSSRQAPEGDEQPATKSRQGTVILVSLDLLPQEVDQLLADWPQITAAATSMPACRYIRLLHDRHDDMRWLVATEWDDAEAFDDFMRKSGLQWRGRARALNDQTRYAYFDVFASPAQPAEGRDTILTVSSISDTQVCS